MKYWFAADCGGTKAAAILYDEDFVRRGVCVTGSVRQNTTSEALAAAHTRTLVETLGLKGLTLEEAAGAVDPRVMRAVKESCTVLRQGVSGEAELGLAAAGIFGDGMLALCGTGATVFAKVGKKTLVAGGYGAAVADEGSGYYVGREGLIAAIRDSEGRGAPTALTDLLPAHLGFPGGRSLRDAVFSVYGKTDMSPAASVAGCAPVVIEAARRGDPVSVRILTEAGGLIAAQLRYLIRRNGLPENLPLTVSGSMWRNNPVMFRAFCDTLFPGEGEARVILPRLEPVLGVPARQMYEKEGEFTGESVKRLLSQFPEFEYDISKKKTTA